jgi:DNA-binding NarL/FixJ family response regulator
MEKLLNCIIVDKNVTNIEILSEYIAQISFIELKAIFDNPMEALTYSQQNAIDLLIADIDMPELLGVQLAECIALQSTTQVIFMSEFAEKMYEALRQHSALDYLPKDVSFERFEKSIVKFVNLSKANLDKYKDIPSQILDKAFQNWHKLSKTERKILHLVATGKTTKEVADKQFTTAGTIEVHRNNIRKKLELSPSVNLRTVAMFLEENT